MQIQRCTNADMYVHIPLKLWEPNFN